MFLTLLKWVHHYYLVSFDCFPLFLHFLISLIKLLLWLKFFHRQEAGWGHGRGLGGGGLGVARTIRSSSASVRHNNFLCHPLEILPESGMGTLVLKLGHMLVSPGEFLKHWYLGSNIKDSNSVDMGYELSISFFSFFFMFWVILIRREVWQLLL